MKRRQASEEEQTRERLAKLRAELDESKKAVRYAKRWQKCQSARSDLIDFTELMMPEPADLEDCERSRYKPVKHHRIIAAAMQEIEASRYTKLIITLPPRSGKTTLISNNFVPWFMGRNPYKSVILASYNETLACDIGRVVRDGMQSPPYLEIFNDVTLKAGSAASDRLETKQGGLAVFTGMGGSLTGRGGDVLIIDDPTKDAQEAASEAFRRSQWDWYTKVFITRRMTDKSGIVIVTTRWHSDDIVGRLTDPESDFYQHEEAKQWKILNLAALADDDDPMGREPGESLWPERFSVEYYESIRLVDPKGFASLYQGEPTLEDGEFFKEQYLRTYMPNELPKNLRYYAGSDHAVSTKQTRDATALVPAGLDEHAILWILPDVWWQRQETDKVVEAMINLMAKYKMLLWWAERGQISKSIGPFLRTRMMERRVFVAVDEVTPVADKQSRAQAFQARCAMGLVRFPAFAPWWSKALAELLAFPSGKHDDIVDALAYLGLGLAKQIPATKTTPPVSQEPKVGTIAWVKWAAAEEKRTRHLTATRGF